MRKRLFIRSVSAAIVFVLAFILPPGPRLTIVGRLKGEVTYQGRPVSYWAADITAFWNKVRTQRTRGLWEELTQQIGGLGRTPPAILFTPDPNDPDAVPMLLALLRHEDVEVRRSAVIGFGKLGPSARSAIRDLIEVLDDEDMDFRIHLAWTLGNLGPAGRGAVSELETRATMLVRTSDQKSQTTAVYWAHALLRIDPHNTIAIQTIQAALRSNIAAVATFAGDTVVRYGSAAKSLLPDLEEALANPDGYVSIQAARAIFEFDSEPGSAKAFAVLVKHLAAGNTNVAATAAYQLYCVRNVLPRECGKELEKAFSGIRSRETRATIIKVLEKVDPAVADQLRGK